MRNILRYKLFESKESVEDICKKYNIRNWTLNEDGSIDVDGDVNLRSKGLMELPLKFGKVNGFFNCAYNRLTSLEGSPNWVGGGFWCSNNKLTSLVGGPNWVGGDFYCTWNKLTSLEGCPEIVYGDLLCHWNKIISLDHYPTILTGQLLTYDNPIDEIWEHVIKYKPNNHGHYLHLFDLHGPIRYEGGQWVCYMECLDNFFDEIEIPSLLPKLKNYKKV